MSTLIEQLRYVHLGSRDPEAAAHFAVERLGMAVAGNEGGIWQLRDDARAFSLSFSSGREQAVGLKVRSAEALDVIAERLAARGIASRHDPALAKLRQAKELLAFTTPGGITIELVWRPMDKGWRFFPTREIGLLGLADVALRSADVAVDEALLVEVLELRVADWIGDASYLGFDAAHHRLSLHPSTATGVLALEFQLDCLDQVMQAWYRLRDAGETPAHGPGRRPASGQGFLTFDGPDDIHYSVVCDGNAVAADARPRQFVAEPGSYCAWGSDCRIAEYGAQDAPVRGRPQLRGV
ncbi:MAG: hypothetical protein WA956_00160 [Stenotrophomonas sp.]